MELLLLQLVLAWIPSLGLPAFLTEILMQVVPQVLPRLLAEVEARLPPEKVAEIAVLAMREGGKAGATAFAWAAKHAPQTIPQDVKDDAGNYKGADRPARPYAPLAPGDKLREGGG